MIDGDVQIDLTQADSGLNTPRGTKRLGGGDNPSPKKSPQKAHKVQNGKYTHNRGDTALCEAFQTGACTSKGKGTRCGADASKAHHCNKCLSSEHGGDACNKPVPTQHPRFERPTFSGKGKKGEGKSKGKGKGHY